MLGLPWQEPAGRREGRARVCVSVGPVKATEGFGRGIGCGLVRLQGSAQLVCPVGRGRREALEMMAYGEWSRLNQMRPGGGTWG